MENKIIDIEVPVTLHIESSELSDFVMDAIYSYLDERVFPDGFYLESFDCETEKNIIKKIKNILINLWAEN